MVWFGKKPLSISLVEEYEGIVIDVKQRDVLQEDKEDLSLREFSNGHHLKKYFEEIIDRKLGIFLLQSFDT